MEGNAGADRFFAKDGAEDRLIGGTGADAAVRRDGTDVLRSVP